MVEPSFGSDTTRLSTARSLPGNKERISNGALGLILGLGLGDKQLCLDYEFHIDAASTTTIRLLL